MESGFELKGIQPNLLFNHNRIPKAFLVGLTSSVKAEDLERRGNDEVTFFLLQGQSNGNGCKMRGGWGSPGRQERGSIQFHASFRKSLLVVLFSSLFKLWAVLVWNMSEFLVTLSFKMDPNSRPLEGGLDLVPWFCWSEADGAVCGFWHGATRHGGFSLLSGTTSSR